jgi:hypothetical protein
MRRDNPGMSPLPSPDRLKSRSVMICTPIARSPVWQYAVALAETCVLLQGLGVKFHYASVVGSSNLARARNLLVARFLASGATDLMFIDDDIGWDQTDLVRLLASDQPLIAGIARRKIDRPDDVSGWSCELLGDPEAPIAADADGNIEIARAGTGFMRIRRGVFEEMMRAHPEWKRGPVVDLSVAEQAFYHRFFMFGDDDQLSEDYLFCDRWRELGGRVFVDPRLTLSHVGEKAYGGAFDELLQVLEQRRGLRTGISLRLSGTVQP